MYNYNIMAQQNKTLSKKVGKRIKELRERAGLKQFELAEMLEMEPTNLSKIENGVFIPREEKLYKIANSLNVEIKDLFDIDHIDSNENIIQKISQYLTLLDNKDLVFFYKILKVFVESK